jgi:hypothetical protein
LIEKDCFLNKKLDFSNFLEYMLFICFGEASSNLIEIENLIEEFLLRKLFVFCLEINKYKKIKYL